MHLQEISFWRGSYLSQMNALDSTLYGKYVFASSSLSPKLQTDTHKMEKFAEPLPKHLALPVLTNVKQNVRASRTALGNAQDGTHPKSK